ncbi:hypothetical protein [Aestuariispira insulae]|uniref:Amino acid ABC transporter substrate-binding protein (PAAT family) n=1 Tax=Aestuariispira insulae TaxID=1461337 RepID=A0A3D9HS17_9PROT|nr:hypothetical protein [Aestuariispira insulae]RED52260.1 hypothetical protein DFP90_102278 [Aestuariispira insulae]
MIGRIANDASSMTASNLLASFYRELGIPVVFRDFPARRSLVMAGQNMLDGETIRIKEVAEEYPNLIAVQSPLIFIRGRLFTIQETRKINSLKDVADLNIGVVRGILIHEQITEGYQQRFANNLISLFTNLEKDKIQIVLAEELGGQLQIQMHFPDSGIHAVGAPVYEKPLFHYLNRRHRDIALRLGELIERYHREGRYEMALESAMQTTVEKRLK